MIGYLNSFLSLLAFLRQNQQTRLVVLFCVGPIQKDRSFSGGMLKIETFKTHTCTLRSLNRMRYCYRATNGTETTRIGTKRFIDTFSILNTNSKY